MSEKLLHELQLFIEHPILLSAFFSMFLAQFLKALIEIVKRKSKSSKDLVGTLLWKTGGMPSSHSSLVTAIAVTAGITEGFNSPIFIVTLFYGMIIIRDAMGVRRTAGQLAQSYNSFAEKIAEKEGIEFEKVKEVNGHSPLEVTVGSLLGLFVALAFSLL